MNLDGGLASIVTDRNREEAQDPETPFSAFRTDMLYTVFGKLFQGQFSATTVSLTSTLTLGIPNSGSTRKAQGQAYLYL